MERYLDTTVQGQIESTYDLSCVIVHEGTATSGHYTCFARPDLDYPDLWLRLNDETVSETDFERVMTESTGWEASRKEEPSKNAYILQYVKRE
jgi:uncharacterized UBP type Zn finger protein